MSAPRVRSIRGQVTLVATLGTFVAMVIVVAATAFAMELLLKSTIEESLSAQLDKAQVAVEAGDYERAVSYAGNNLLQVIDADGKVVASSASAEGLGPILDPQDGGKDGKFEVREPELKQEGASGDAKSRAKTADTSSDGSAGSKSSGRSSSSTGTSGSSKSGKPSKSSGSSGGSSGGLSGTSSKSGAISKSSSSNKSSGSSGKDNGSSTGTGAGNSSGDKKPSDPGAQKQPTDPVANTGTGDAAKTGGGNAQQPKQPDANAGVGKNEPGGMVGPVPKGQQDAMRPQSTEPAAHAPAAAGLLGATQAFADDSTDGTYVDASSVLGDDGPYLVMQRTVNAPNETVTLAAMASLAPALRSALTTALVLAVLLLVVLALVAVAAWHLSGRTLRPVNRMRLQAESINTSDLGQRIEVPEGDRDLSDLAHTFNELLGRIEASVDEQKRFISDASHELKSPVAATGIMIETLRKRPGNVDLDKLTADLGAENKRMAQIVGDMLLLARQDENRMHVEKTPVDLFDLLYEEAAGLRSRSSVGVDSSGLQPVILQADAELLSHAVRNLADNAARYAKSTVKLSCSQEGEHVHILVSDDGPGIPPEDRVRVFDRFVRLEDSRSRKKGSTGLGLAVVRGIVERHNGEVSFEDPELGGATARIILPVE